MVYTEKYKIKWHDTGANRVVKPSSVLMYMQETASLQCENLGHSLDKLRDEKGLAFLLSRISISFYAELHAFDEIEVDTWVSEGKACNFPRCFRIRRNGQTVAEAISMWALYDLNQNKLVRFNDFDYGFSTEPLVELDLPRRIHFPTDTHLNLVGERTIYYSDLDYNMHMNNTKYPDMVCDFINGFGDKKLACMTLVYIRESKFNDNMKVYLTESDGSYFVRTVNPQGETCLEAEVIFE